MVEHTKIREYISSYIDGHITSEEQRQVEDHILECKSCQSYIKELQGISAKLKEWPDEDLSPDLEQKIRKTLLEVRKKEGHKMKTSIPIYKWSVGGGALAAIVLAVILMQTYAQRIMLARVRDASQFIPKIAANKPVGGDKKAYQMKSTVDTIVSSKPTSSELASLGESDQYDPYYLRTDYELHRKAGRKELNKLAAVSSPETPAIRDRAVGGFQKSSYDPQVLGANVYGLAGRPVAESEMLSREISPSEFGDEGWRYNAQFHTEQYDRIYENEFLEVTENPLSTFSIDVDTASYSNLRRFLNNNQLPPADAVRIEEMINYFTYDYSNPKGEDPFSVNINAAACPWNSRHQLVKVGLQGKTLDAENIPPSNLVFLMDVSGSMNQPNKLPLLKTGFKMLVNQLRAQERVAIVVYAGAAGLVLDSTPGADKQKIIQAIDNMNAGGSTAGGAGIKLAYKVAQENLIKGGNNRVILATDGDFNIGASSDAEMVRLIEEKRNEGIFLTVLGFGTGNYKDAKMEKIADKGNGNYYYIDTQKEAKKVLVSELGSTLFTIAKDVKIQIEFNPAQIKAYRLIGYENRILAKEDFNDDTKDAGEMGAGHSVTALYEIVPADSQEEFGDVDALVYQQRKMTSSDDLLTVKLRYKEPDGFNSKLIKETINIAEIAGEPTGDFQFAAAVAEFGLLLRDSKFKENAAYGQVLKSAQEAQGKDTFGYREEFINLVRKAQSLDSRTSDTPADKPGIIFKGQ